MSEAESDTILKEVKRCYGKITEYSQRADVDGFLSYYDDSPHFLSFGSDGKMNNYEAFKKACAEYYSSLKEQKSPQPGKISTYLIKILSLQAGQVTS